MRTGGKLSLRKRGMAMILTALMLTFIIPVVGLAIDAGIMYFVKASLSAAVDGAALAAARSLNVGLTLAEQTASATARAQAYFNANFPPGYMFTSNAAVSVAVAQNGFKTRTVTLTGTATAPTYFMRMIGVNSLDGSASAEASRRDVDMIIVADRSGSMTSNNACAALRSAATQFINNFANGRDRIGLLEFGGTTNLDYAPTLNFRSGAPTLATAIGNIVCQGTTNTATAIAEAYQQLQAINEPGALNLILLFTDGRPTALTASFPIKKLADTRWDNSNPNRATVTPPSTCKDSAGRTYPNVAWNPAPVTGAMAAYFVGQDQTWGINNYHAVSQANPAEYTVTTAPGAVTAGCAFNGAFNPFSPSANPGQSAVRRDIAYIPDLDYFANSTHGYQPLTTFSAGPYIGKIRPDELTTVQNAAYNAADNAATRARNDASLTPIFYVIGLGGNDAEGIDHQFLQRIANVPASAIYDSSKGMGLYIYSPSIQDLGDAFATVAGEILRVSH